jgi:regulator of replication initiation timing
LAERDRHIQQADADLKAARDQVEALLTENSSLKSKIAGLTATLDDKRKSAEERLTTAQQTAAARQADNEKAAGERLAAVEKAAAEILLAAEDAAAERLAAADKASADRLAAFQTAADERLAVAEKAGQEKLPRRGNLWVIDELQPAFSVRNRRNFRQVESNDLC